MAKRAHDRDCLRAKSEMIELHSQQAPVDTAATSVEHPIREQDVAERQEDGCCEVGPESGRDPLMGNWLGEIWEGCISPLVLQDVARSDG